MKDNDSVSVRYSAKLILTLADYNPLRVAQATLQLPDDVPFDWEPEKTCGVRQLLVQLGIKGHVWALELLARIAERNPQFKGIVGRWETAEQMEERFHVVFGPSAELMMRRIGREETEFPPLQPGEDPGDDSANHEDPDEEDDDPEYDAWVDSLRYGPPLLRCDCEACGDEETTMSSGHPDGEQDHTAGIVEALGVVPESDPKPMR